MNYIKFLLSGSYREEIQKDFSKKVVSDLNAVEIKMTEIYEELKAHLNCNLEFKRGVA